MVWFDEEIMEVAFSVAAECGSRVKKIVRQYPSVEVGLSLRIVDWPHARPDSPLPYSRLTPEARAQLSELSQ